MNGFFILVLFTLLAVMGGPSLWKRNAAARLKAGSQRVETEFGLIEYAILNPQTSDSKFPVLVIHGTPGGYDQGMMLGRHNFDPGQMVIAVSRPGYLGTPLETAKTITAQADVYAALLALLNVQRVIVFGVAGGGPSAVQFALRHPQQTAGLILGSAAVQAIELSVDELPAFMTTTIGSWLTFTLAKFMPSLLGKPVADDPSLLKPALALAATSFPLDLRLDGWRNDSQQLRALPQVPFEQIQCPTLFIHGTGDETIPLAHAQAAANAIPNAELMCVEGGKLIYAVMNAAAVQRIRTFVQSVNSLSGDKIAADTRAAVDTPLHPS